MASLKALRNRIASVKATRKITKAQQMVAASKFRRALDAAVAARPPADWVFPPRAFDVTVRPGECVQEAVERCPRGGSILLLPGVHEGPLVLGPEDEVHVFGQGRAVLRVKWGCAVSSEAYCSTLDGLMLRRDWGEAGVLDDDDRNCCVFVRSGRLRVQVCDLRSTTNAAYFASGSSAVFSACRCVTGSSTPFPSYVPFPPSL